MIARGPDLPNDVLVAGRHVPQEKVEKIRTVFGDHSDQIVKAILVGERNQKYAGMKFLTNIKDSNYDYIRKMYATAGYGEYSKAAG